MSGLCLFRKSVSYMTLWFEPFSSAIVFCLDFYICGLCVN